VVVVLAALLYTATGYTCKNDGIAVVLMVKRRFASFHSPPVVW